MLATFALGYVFGLGSIPLSIGLASSALRWRLGTQGFRDVRERLGKKFWRGHQ